MGNGCWLHSLQSPKDFPEEWSTWAKISSSSWLSEGCGSLGEVSQQRAQVSSKQVGKASWLGGQSRRTELR